MSHSSDSRRSGSTIDRVVQPAATGKRRADRPPTLWRAFTGFGLWAVCFTALYAGHALGCEYMAGMSASVVMYLSASMDSLSWLLAALWGLFVLGMVFLTVRSWARVQALRSWARAQPTNQCTQAGRVLQTAGAPTADGDSQASDEVSASMASRHRSARFMVVLTFVADLSAVAITVVSGLPIFMTPACL